MKPLTKIDLGLFTVVLKHVWYITGLSLIISTLHKAIDRGTQYLCLLCTDVLWILIRNDNNNEGITIDGEEFKLSQYADTTLSIFVGSLDSPCTRLLWSYIWPKNKFLYEISLWHTFLKKYFTLPDGNLVEIIVFLIS